MVDYISKLLYKVEQCIDYQNLYALEESFNKCGLTIQATSNRRMVLAKIKNGKVVANNIIEDFIFVGSYDEANRELTDRAVEKICDFIRNNAGKPGKIKNVPRVFRGGIKMYGNTIDVKNEDVSVIADGLIEG